MAATARKNRRRTQYSVSISAQIDPAMRAELEAEADAADMTLAEVIRESIQRGLPLMRRCRLERERRNGGAK